MEQLSIVNFAGIGQMDFEFRAMNVIMGPQGSGKSISIKLLYFFKSLALEITQAIQKDPSANKRAMDQVLLDKFKLFFPNSSWPKSDFSLRYQYAEYEFIIMQKNGKLSMHYPDALHKHIGKLKKSVQNFDKAKMAEIMQGFKLFFGENALAYPVFIPAGRSFFANIYENIFSILSHNATIDPFLTNFGALYETAKHQLAMPSQDPLLQNINQLFQAMLNGQYLKENNRDFILHHDGRKIPLDKASSGQQELLPLSFIIQKTLNDHEPFVLYIEEPEAHLFPDAQKQIVEILAMLFNGTASKGQIYITTHSSYVLSSFNNLMYAGYLANLSPSYAEQLSHIIPENRHLKSHELSAYSLQDGACTDLIDHEEHLINTNVLDAVSGSNLALYEQLINVEFP